MARRAPRTKPYSSIASAAYSEHVGVNRHAAGSQGETITLYARTIFTARVCVIPDSSLCSKKCLQFRLQLIKLPVKDGPSRIDNDIETGRELSPCSAQKFSNPSADSVSIVRFAQLPRRGHAEAAVFQRIWQHKDDKRARSLFHTFFVDVQKLSRLSQTKVFWKCVRFRDGTPRNGGQD